MLKIFQNRLPRVRMAGLALLLVPGMALAEVSYVRELTPVHGSSPASAAIVSLAQAPVNTSDPLYDPDTANTQWIFSRKHSHAFDIRTGVVPGALQLPQSVQVPEDSFATLTGVGTTAPLVRIWGRRNTLYTYDITTNLLVDSVIMPVWVATSLAAQGTHLTLIGDQKGYSINPDTWELTEIFQTQEVEIGVKMGLGEFSTDTRYQAYGANGLLYVLDYGNKRIQMLDPENNFAAIDGFGLQDGVRTANFQFAIGSTGNVYLGDGLGGGSYYDWDGDYLGAFTLPGSVVSTLPPDGSASYLSTDQKGGVYVIDSTGFHQYLDAGVVPEPSAICLLLGAAALLLSTHRHRRLPR